MLARTLFVLVSIISTVSYADGGLLLVKFRGLEGSKCELAPGKKNSLLYIERDFAVDNLRVGSESGNLDTHALMLDLGSIPLASAKDKLRISFRGHHGLYREHIYYVAETLTRESIESIESGRWQPRDFPTSIINERGREEKSKCVLNLEFMKTN